MAITNVNDLSVATRQKIADEAKKAGLTGIEGANYVKAQLAKVGVTETNPVVPVVKALTKSELEAKIKSGNFSATEASDYNKITGNQSGARDLMLGSQTAMNNSNVNTVVNTQDLQIAKKAGVTNLGENIVVDPQVAIDKQNADNLKKAQEEQKKATEIKPIQGNGTVVSEPVVSEPVVTQPVTPTETKPTVDLTKIQTVDDWKKQTGGGINNLESWLEARYNTVATQKDGKITADIGGKTYEWSLDQAGNPIKTEVQKITTPNELFQNMVSGIEIPTNLPNYKEVKLRYDRFNGLKNLNDSQLQVVLEKGILLPGTLVYNDLMNDPTQKIRIQNLEKLNTIKGVKIDTEKVYDTSSNEILNNTNATIDGNTITLNDALKDGYLTADEINAVTNTKEVMTKQEEVQAKKDEVSRLQSQYDAIEKDVDEELKNTGATKSEKATVLANRREEMLPGLNLAISYYNNALGTLTQMKADNASLFATNLQLYQNAKTREQTLADLKESRTYAENQAIKNLELQAQYTYGDINSENPTLQNIAITKAVNDLYVNYPIKGMEIPSVKIAKVKALMEKGLSGAEAIAQVEQEIRSTQSYKDMIKGQQEAFNPTPIVTATSDYTFTKLDNGKILKANNKNGTTEIIDENQLPDVMPTSLPRLEKLAEQPFVQCGRAVNTYIQDVTGEYGKMGNTLDSKMEALNNIGKSSVPVEGGIFVSNPLNNNIGHTGIIKKVNADGSVVVIEANAKGALIGGPVVEKTYSADKVAKMTFSKGLSSTKETPVSSEAQNWIETWNRGAMDLETILTKIGSSKEALALKNEVIKGVSNQGGIAWRKDTDPAVVQMQKLKDITTELVNNTAMAEDVSGAYQFSPWDMLTKKKQTYLNKIQSLLDTGTLQNLIDAKANGATFGALSNEELKMLQASAGVLNTAAIRNDKQKITGFDMTEEAFKKELGILEKLYSDKITKMTGSGIAPVSINNNTPTNNTPTNNTPTNNTTPINTGTPGNPLGLNLKK